MKRKAIFIIIVFSTLTNAKDSADNIDIKSCEAFSKFAESAMMARQNKVRLIDVYKAIENEKPDIRKIMGTIINGAYEYPIYKDRDYVRFVAQEYSNIFFKICIEPK